MCADNYRYQYNQGELDHNADYYADYHIYIAKHFAENYAVRAEYLHAAYLATRADYFPTNDYAAISLAMLVK